VEYTYLGLGTIVATSAPEPGVTWSLKSGGDPVNPYAGLDPFGRVIDCPWSGTSGTLEELQYTYDRSSNRTSRHNPVAPDGGNDELYAYDGLQRLVDMSRGDLAESDTVIDNPNFGQSWQLDATGNWSGFKTLDTATPANNLDQQRTSNPANELTDVTRRYGAAWVTPEYDRAGNMTSIPSGLDPTAALGGTYDAWNRLVSLSGTASYRYDGLNRRITKTVGSDTRDYFYSSGWQSLEEWLGGTLDRQFVWGLRYIDDLVLRDRLNSDGSLVDRYYALQDANWNVTAICSDEGTIAERYRYSPYGVPTFLNASFSTKDASSYDWETLYAGYRWETDCGLYQVRWRWLAAILGIWTTVDPLRGTAGDVNHVGYVEMNPATNIDPLGLLCWTAGERVVVKPRTYTVTQRELRLGMSYQTELGGDTTNMPVFGPFGGIQMTEHVMNFQIQKVDVFTPPIPTAAPLSEPITAEPAAPTPILGQRTGGQPADLSARSLGPFGGDLTSIPLPPVWANLTNSDIYALNHGQLNGTSCKQSFGVSGTCINNVTKRVVSVMFSASSEGTIVYDMLGGWICQATDPPNRTDVQERCDKLPDN
jgi:RHS repeat-associated protein